MDKKTNRPIQYNLDLRQDSDVKLMSRTTNWRYNKFRRSEENFMLQSNDTDTLNAQNLEAFDLLSKSATVSSSSSDSEAEDLEYMSNGDLIVRLLTNEEFMEAEIEDIDELHEEPVEDEPTVVIEDESDEEEEIRGDELPENTYKKQDRTLFDLNYLSTPLYSNSKLTIGETILMIETYITRHSLSKVAADDLLSFLQIIIHRNDLPHSMYSFRNIFAEVLDIISYCICCKSCGEQLKTIKRSEVSKVILTCSNCNTDNESNLKSGCYVAVFDLQKQFQIFLENPEIHTAIRKNEEKRHINDVIFQEQNIIEDVYDGSTYTKLKQPGEILSEVNNFSIHFNLDGGSFFKSSKSSCWPIQMILNELPIMLRHRKLLLAGIWFGSQKPKIDIFLSIFCEQLNILLDKGFLWKDMNGKITLSKIVALCCCVDSVAQAKILESMQFNGEYGCAWCYNPGTVINRTRRYLNFIDTTSVKFCKYDVELDEKEVLIYKERTKESVTAAMLKAYDTNVNAIYETDIKPCKGYKGISELTSLSHFDMLWGCPPDELHGPEEGVLGNVLFESWFNKKRSSVKYYIGHPAALSELKKRLTAIKPPREIHRLPRDISLRKFWKGTEFKSFLLYYGIPCLKGILPEKYLNHFALFVEGINLLSQQSISPNDLHRSKQLLTIFVRDFEHHYGEDKMTSNVHSLPHFPTAVEKNGPLWSFSTYPFEAYLSVIKNYTHSSNGVSIQIAEQVARKEALHVLKKHLKPTSDVESFIERLANGNSRSLGTKIQDCVLMGGGKVIQVEEHEQNLLQENGIEAFRFKRYTKIIYKGYTYASVKHTKAWKRDNSISELVDGSICQIMRFIVIDNTCKVFVKILNTANVKQGGIVLTHIKEICCMQRNEIKLIDVTDLAGLWIHIVIKPTVRYVCRLMQYGEVQ